MKALALNQYITYLFNKRPREGEIIDYHSKYGYRVKSVYGVSWVKRKNIVESEGLYQDRSRYTVVDTPAMFSFTLE